MQQQIEDLKQVQMEKQLLLKEAATRKKLLALKQQLQADSATPKLTAKVNNAASSRTADDIKAVPKTAQSEKMHTTEHEGITRLSVSMNGNWPTRLGVKLQPSEISPPPSSSSSINTTTTTTSTIKINSSMSQDTSFVKDEKKLKFKKSSFGPLSLDTTTLSDKASATDHKPDVIASVNKTKQMSSPRVDKREVIIANQTKSSAKESNDHVPTVAGNSNTSTRQRLAVPDKIKETEYMSAVTKQKARVSRIRKAIQAAVVIQRAWRKYKQNHVILK